DTAWMALATQDGRLRAATPSGGRRPGPDDRLSQNLAVRRVHRGTRHPHGNLRRTHRTVDSSRVHKSHRRHTVCMNRCSDAAMTPPATSATIRHRRSAKAPNRKEVVYGARRALLMGLIIVAFMIFPHFEIARRRSR